MPLQELAHTVYEPLQLFPWRVQDDRHTTTLLDPETSFHYLQSE
jgi:hypothetical protein